MPASVSSFQLRVGARTHTGTVRSENQDRMSRFATPFGQVFLVADGVGGHRGGAMAATMTVEGFGQYLQAADSTDTPQLALQQAAQHTNAEIYRLAHSGDPAVARMGSTVVLALVSDRQLIVGHAGDSRAYLFREGQLQRLTRDHSIIQKMLDHNLLTEEQARNHPDANVIERAFGQREDIALEVSAPITLQPGDGVLLCSDGLCGYVDDDAIAQVLNTHTDAQRLADALVNLALSVGGLDNVTVQFLQFGAPRGLEANVSDAVQSSSPSSAESAAPRRRLGLTILLVSAFLLGMLAMVFAGRMRGWFARQPAPAAAAPTLAPTATQVPEGERKEEGPTKANETATPATPQPEDAPPPRH